MVLIRRKKKDLEKLQVELKSLQETINILLQTGSLSGRAGVSAHSMSLVPEENKFIHDFTACSNQRELFAPFAVL